MARTVDLVLVRAATPAQLTRLRGVRGPGRILAVVPLGRRFNERSWRRAIAEARASRHLDLVVAPRGAGGEASLAKFLALLKPSTTMPVPPPRPPSVFVATNGNDANACTQAAPCRTFNRAYRVAQSGQVVEVAGGSYPYQQINHDPAKTSDADVVFQPAPGADVFVLRFALGNGLGTAAASHVTVRDIRSGEMQAFTPARDVTWINLDSGNFYIRGVQDMRILGGDFGPCRTQSPPEVCGASNSKIDHPAGEQPNNNIVIDGAVFHDYRIDNINDHFECVFFAGGTNVTFRNSKFFNCEFYNIFMQYHGSPFDGLRIENNWFDQPWNGRGVQNRDTGISFGCGTTWRDVLIRFNSFRNTGITIGSGCGGGYSNVRIVGNIVDAGGCHSAVSYAYNLMQGGTCAASDRSFSGSYPYVNPVGGTAGDYHVTGGPAVDLVTPSDGDYDLADDIDRQSRPLGAARDAGSDER